MFNSKVVIITGSSAGIGAGAAVHFARECAAGVVINGRVEDRLNAVKAKCEQAGNGKTKVVSCVGDVTIDEVREKLINETLKEFGRIDILVNNAGGGTLGAVAETPIESFDQTLDLNVRAVVALTKLAIPHLIKTGGNVVNISSIAGLRAITGGTFYCMAKAALDHFSRCLAVELGPKGVRVNSVNPGLNPETDGFARAGFSAEQLEKYVEAEMIKYPLRRPGTVDEVADAILFLASDKAKFITGVSLPIDGGYTVA